MVERSPILLQDLWAVGPPLRRIQRLGLLGPGLLLGDLPRDATHAWPSVTPQQVFATPDAVVAAGLHGDTLCWLLRPRRLLGLLTSALRVGRSDDNDLVVPHALVGRRHARILTQGRRVSVVDLDSTPGTFVNGTRLAARQARELTEGDRVAFGPVVLTYWRAVSLVDLVLQDRVDRSQ